MLYHIRSNAKHPNSDRTAFLEQVRAYDPVSIDVVVSTDDLIDPKGAMGLGNLPFNSYHLSLVNTVRLVDGTQLFPVVNTKENNEV